MKRGTPDHPKVLLLAKLLGVQKYGAVGVLECLWHWAARYAPQGNIGKYTDLQIAHGVGWQRPSGRRGVGSEVVLSTALVDSGWVDRCPVHRLLLHDWKDHADQAVIKYVSRHRLEIYSLSMPLSEPEPIPIPVAVTPTLPQEKKPRQKAAGLDDPDFCSVWEAYPKGHGSRAAGWKNWKKLKADHQLPPVENIIAGINAWKISERWKNGYIKDFEKFISGQLWENPAKPEDPWVVDKNGEKRNRISGMPYRPCPYTPEQLIELSKPIVGGYDDSPAPADNETQPPDPEYVR